MLAIVLGTRPEIIKMSPIIRECERRCVEYFILHTGQHYSYEMDRTFFDELELPEPKYNLDVGSGTHAEQTGRIMQGIEKILLEEKPDVVLVQGDTNTVLAGALAAAKLHIRVSHVEAGLRSYDRRMPEEINRVMADHISDILFAPTDTARQNLRKEGVDASKIFITGNTVVDALFQNREIVKRKSTILKKVNLTAGQYIVVTAHRSENVDDSHRLNELISGIRKVQEIINVPVIFPMHPRTQKMIKEFGVSTKGIIILDPVGYLDFLDLEAHAGLILTDSGGVQEEACILQVPCVTLRENTERPETVEVGANVLAGSDPERIIECAKRMVSCSRNWSNPYGDGKAGEMIIDICTDSLRKV
ncbi:non-hydrolyzing UDP-N-acetylglucosamine 2-epimerase [Methanospirillum sp.]